MEVGQFIYMRLDKTESQRGVGGFQTLFFTRSLILETRMEEIESLLQFDAASDEPQLIFHAVGDQEVVLVQLQSIPDVDTCGRGGNFVAHGIVLSHDQFLSTGGNPITLANDTPFIATGKDARCLGDIATGDIKPYEIPTNSINIPSEILEETRWTGPELRKLLATTAYLSGPPAKRATVAVHGPAVGILETLQLIYELIPRSLRPTFSFTTHSQRAERGGATFQGFRTCPPHDGFAEIDATHCVAECFEQVETSFGRWVLQTSIAHTPTDFHRLNECCWGFGSLIDCGDSDTIDLPGNDEVADEFWQLNLDAAPRRLFEVYQQRAGEALSRRALKHLLLRHRPIELFGQIFDGGHDVALAEAIHWAYCEASQPPAHDERIQLSQLLGRFDNDALMIWLAVWTTDWPVLERRLRSMRDRDLAQFVANISELDYIDIARFLLPGRERAVLDGLLDTGDSFGARNTKVTSVSEAIPRAPIQLKAFSNQRLEKLICLISLKSELFTDKAIQAITDECSRRGIIRSKGTSFSWWRSR